MCYFFVLVTLGVRGGDSPASVPTRTLGKTHSSQRPREGIKGELGAGERERTVPEDERNGQSRGIEVPLPSMAVEV